MLCSMNREDEKRVQSFGWNVEKEEHSEVIGLNGRVISQWILRE
jgi:ABC-type molybdenum transport system ATPase subunit/photorepair protein PhrA